MCLGEVRAVVPAEAPQQGQPGGEQIVLLPATRATAHSISLPLPNEITELS